MSTSSSFQSRSSLSDFLLQTDCPLPASPSVYCCLCFPLSQVRSLRDGRTLPRRRSPRVDISDTRTNARGAEGEKRGRRRRKKGVCEELDTHAHTTHVGTQTTIHFAHCVEMGKQMKRHAEERERERGATICQKSESNFVWHLSLFLCCGSFYSQSWNL